MAEGRGGGGIKRGRHITTDSVCVCVCVWRVEGGGGRGRSVLLISQDNSSPPWTPSVNRYRAPSPTQI